ncbi:MAG: quinolinate synthase NadA [Clostridia bacterium]|nr:quinolinate synthase NadA [Clostridia bacterium]
MNKIPTNDAEIIQKISELKEEKGALVLAHYYENLDIQHAADFCGDSFELAKRARESRKQIIVFCGVSFMAESAKIMNPEKRVFIPRADAGCQMADMVTPEIVLEMKKQHPNAAVVCYINSSAATKAVSDICVTSSNALKIISTLKEKEIIFVPDKNLGSFAAKHFPDKTFHFMQGWCPVHNDLTGEDLRRAKAEYPNAVVAIHPEAKAKILAECDYIGSTSGILDYCRMSDKNEFIIATERAIVERLSEEMPSKKFHLMSPCLTCPDMKKTTLSDLLYCLENLNNEVFMTPDKICAAKQPLERMLEAAKD